MSRINVIVNADDFGVDENRTKAILKSFEMGAVTYTTAMVNMPYFRTAWGMIRDAGLRDRMGLHLNLTEGRAMTERMRLCRYFCDGDGCFTAAFHHRTKTRFVLPSCLQDILRGEIEAQMQAFVNCGATSRHLDSHHHVHTDYAIARIALPLARKYGFTSVRLSRNLCVDGLAKRIYKTFFNGVMIRSVGSRSDYFGSFGDLRTMVAALPKASVVEVMVHPMYGTLSKLDLTEELTDSGCPIAEELDFYSANVESLEIAK